MPDIVFKSFYEQYEEALDRMAERGRLPDAVTMSRKDANRLKQELSSIHASRGLPLYAHTDDLSFRVLGVTIIAGD